MNAQHTHTAIPTRWIGPLIFKSMHYLDFSETDVEISAPLATYETTLFHSTQRGARALKAAKSLETTLVSDYMTRSVLFEASSALEARTIIQSIQKNQDQYQVNIVSKLSKHAQLKKMDTHLVGNLIFIRFAFFTDNASGHNMSTFAADAIADHIHQEFSQLNYVSVSSNFCTDKKNSSVNAILGRGKHVIASAKLSRTVCQDILKTTPEKIIDLNLKKNLIGSIVSGGVQSANAHYANMLLAFYLATGQDGANIVEGSQGITHTYLEDDHLVFSVTLPNIIVGTIGHGKDTQDPALALERMGCSGPHSAQKLAQIAAALVLAGELSLMAALTNPHELSRAHQRIERKDR
jgi:hydroxymethylglutaryl-CoA reductase (NADPH)